MAKHFYQYPSVVVTSSEVATAPNNGSLPGLLKVVAGFDGTDVKVLLTDSSGRLITVSSAPTSSVVTTVRNVYSITNVTTGSWVELVASTSADINKLEIFDSSGQTLEIGTGAALSETRLILLTPGGNGQVAVDIPSGTRISIRAVSATAAVGELDINFYGL